jgi:alkanesulfonate monooxygenase SsuD/methylene tetrahydromethanopterin reductase-like flavin-dependent oxidoreductase (luciferase family)
MNLPNFGDFADVRVLAEIAAAAEAGGWDGFFIWDHLAPGRGLDGEVLEYADVTVALTAIALATAHVRFGAMVHPLPRRRIQKFARELASLDHLSNGRVVCGVGLGYPPDGEYEAFGEPGSDTRRAERLDESLALLTAMWSGTDVDFAGKHLRVRTLPFLPTPVQQPRIPIWVAATWPGKDGPFRRAARYDGIFPMSTDPMEFFITVEDVPGIRDAVGRPDDAFDIVVNGGPDVDLAAFANAGVTWWVETRFTHTAALECATAGPPRVP